MSAKHIWTMTKGKIMEGVFGKYTPQQFDAVLIPDSRQQTDHDIFCAGFTRSPKTLQSF